LTPNSAMAKWYTARQKAASSRPGLAAPPRSGLRFFDRDMAAIRRHAPLEMSHFALA
jgi:hypothetical protein